MPTCEIYAAIRAEVKIITVLLDNSGYQFDDNFAPEGPRSTPQELRDADIYRELAVGLKSGESNEWRQASMVLLAAVAG